VSSRMVRMSCVAALGLAICAAGSTTALAQGSPTFGVASVRPSPDGPPAQGQAGVHITKNQVRFAYLSLRDYLSIAFSVPIQIFRHRGGEHRVSHEAPKRIGKRLRDRSDSRWKNVARRWITSSSTAWSEPRQRIDRPRLKRDIALKILPASFAGDAERLARFQREAEVVASLNLRMSV
jgi:hypothetical protein